MPHRLIWNGECDLCRRAAGQSSGTTGRAHSSCERSQELGLGTLEAVRVDAAAGETLDGGRACLFVAGALWPRTRPVVRLLARPALRAPVEAAYRAGASLRRL